MTVVKIQRPLSENCWVIHDKFKARQQMLNPGELRRDIVKLFDNAPPATAERYVQYFDNAVWDSYFEAWDLGEVTPVTRRLIW